MQGRAEWSVLEKPVDFVIFISLWVVMIQSVRVRLITDGCRKDQLFRNFIGFDVSITFDQ